MMYSRNAAKRVSYTGKLPASRKIPYHPCRLSGLMQVCDGYVPHYRDWFPLGKASQVTGNQSVVQYLTSCVTVRASVQDSLREIHYPCSDLVTVTFTFEDGTPQFPAVR